MACSAKRYNMSRIIVPNQIESIEYYKEMPGTTNAISRFAKSPVKMAQML